MSVKLSKPLFDAQNHDLGSLVHIRGKQKEHHSLPSKARGVGLWNPSHLIRHLKAADLWDVSGIFLSALCLIHCVALPILVLLEIFFFDRNFGETLEHGSSFYSQNFFHILMFLSVSLFAFVAMLRGYRRHHDSLPMRIALLGLFFLLAGLYHSHHDQCIPYFHGMHTSSLWEPLMTSFGGILLVYAHIRNLRQRNCGCDA